MTAKESFESILFTWQPPFDDAEFKEHLLRFAAQLCREQREICAGKVSGWPTKCKLESEIEEDILEAEMPEL